MRFRPLVLCYHAASDRWPHVLALPPREIERQVRSLLRRGFRPVAAADTAARPGERLLAVTFDDALRCVADVLPALERLGVPATVFACPAFSEDGGRLFDIPEIAREVEAYPDVLTAMGWDELRALAERGVEIGSHTISHAHLARLSDEQIRRELTESRERIEAELGRSCRTLAYPYGEHDARCRAAARAAGYEAAFSLPAFGAREPAELYALPRIGLFRGDGLARTFVKTWRPARRLAVASGRRR